MYYCQNCTWKKKSSYTGKIFVFFLAKLSGSNKLIFPMTILDNGSYSIFNYLPSFCWMFILFCYSRRATVVNYNTIQEWVTDSKGQRPTAPMHRYMLWLKSTWNRCVYVCVSVIYNSLHDTFPNQELKEQIKKRCIFFSFKLFLEDC